MLPVLGKGAREFRRRLLVDGAWRARVEVRRDVLGFTSVSEIVSF